MALAGGFQDTSPRGGGATVAGAGTQAGAGAYGGVPQAPSLPGAQQTALGSNLSQMEQIQNIMAQINQQSAQSAIAPLYSALPGLGGAFGQAMGNVQSYLGGQVPADVINLMQQQAAERGVGTGLPGAGIGDAAYLRALGLTSLGLQQQGQQNLTGLMGAIPRGTLMDPSALLMTPGQQYESQWLANQLAAAPNPAEARAAEMAAIQAGMGAGQRGGAGGGGYSITGGPGPGRPVELSSIGPASITRGAGPFTSYAPPVQAYDAWRGAQPSYGISRPTTTGSLYGGSQYGLPTWADTMGQVGGQSYAPTYGYGNQPVSQGQMFMGSPQDYYDDSGMNDWAAEEAAYWGE